MTAIATLSLNDAVPVAHSYVPVTTSGSVAQYADKVTGVPVGYSKISYEVREPQTATAAYRVLIGFNFPVLATIDGVPTKVRNSSGQIIINLAQDSTAQERKDALAIMTNFISNATVKSSVENVEPFY
jgi:hypothetical protein